VTGSFRLFGDGEAIGRRIREAIEAEVHLTASVGVARTKLVAKVASDLRKPDALVVVPPGTEAAFLAPLPITRLWGVGERTAQALREFGVTTIGDLAGLDPSLLGRRFGKMGAALAGRARGLDDDPVSDRGAAKSISHEHTFDVDTADREVIERTLLAMSEGVSGRLRSAGLRAGTVSVKIRDSSFRTITRQRTLDEPTDLTEPIWQTALELARPEIKGMRVRLLGVSASNMDAPDQLAMFGTEGAGSERDRRRRVVEAEDAIRRRYGERTITRARLLGTRLPAPFERDPMTAPEHREPGGGPARADRPGSDVGQRDRPPRRDRPAGR
jgi:DNA polymerase-4